MTDNEAINPCPFCGHRAKLEVVRHGGCQYDYAEISCKHCGATIRKGIDVEISAKDYVIAKWNGRSEQ